MSLITKPSERKFTNTAMSSNIYNYPKYPKHKKGIYLSPRPQRAGFIAKKTPTKVPVEYVNFADMFSLDLASELPKHIRINNHAIELVDANGFIRPSKSPISAFILFDQKSNWSLWLRVNYRGFNNLAKS